MTLIRTLIILSHRYLGIGISLLVIMWFVSGIVMIYAGGMPRLAPALRQERLADLDLTRVRLTAAEAVERARASAPSGRAAGGGDSRVQLLTVMERPAYRIGGATIFADDGQRMDPLDVAQSRGVAARFMRVPENRVRHPATVTAVDQWTLGQGRALPLEKFSVDDAAATELYVQPRSAEVVMLTTRRSRALAWAGVIPHRLYFTALRQNQPLWYRIVVWTSAAACALSVLGLVLAFTQWRKTRPFRLARSIPYSGPMRWHYITGSVFGIFTLTWAFSGLLSMEPFAWTNATGLEVRRDVFTGGRTDVNAFPLLERDTWGRVLNGRAIKEVDFTRIQDRHYFVVRMRPQDTTPQRRERLHQPYAVSGRAETDRVLVDAATLAVRAEVFSQQSLVDRLRLAVPDVPIAEAAVLTDYDAYYYSRGRQTPLPVVRVKFQDPAQTWLYVDPETSQTVAAIHRYNRVERWLYNGLHSLDFAFWYDKRPLWDIGVLTLLLGGLGTSVLGLWMGIKRLRRNAVRMLRPPVRNPMPAVAPAPGAMARSQES